MTKELVFQVENPSETQVVIDSIRVTLDPTKGYKVVVLYSENLRSYLPIWVGSDEGDMIVSELNNIPHQTTTKLLEQIKPTRIPTKISITDLINEVYKATITIAEAGKEIHMPMRPSDVLAVAVRLNLPMIVNNSVMDQAAERPPETDILAKIAFVIATFKTKFLPDYTAQKK